MTTKSRFEILNGDPNVRRLPNGVIVQRVRILTTETHVYTAWISEKTEPGRSMVDGPYQTITTFDTPDGELTASWEDEPRRYGWYGKVGTREFESGLPVGEARFKANRGDRNRQAAAAQFYICEAFPHLVAIGDKKLGDTFIETLDEPRETEASKGASK